MLQIVKTWPISFIRKSKRQLWMRQTKRRSARVESPTGQAWMRQRRRSVLVRRLKWNLCFVMSTWPSLSLLLVLSGNGPASHLCYVCENGGQHMSEYEHMIHMIHHQCLGAYGHWWILSLWESSVHIILICVTFCAKLVSLCCATVPT